MVTVSYGLPTGTRITYGSAGFPPWVYALADHFGLKASTYPNHQESHRNEAGFAPNPNRQNRGIDWSGPVANMQRFADYLMTVKSALEQVIWQNPTTGQKAGVAGGKDVTNTGYYSADYAGHRDHVHTRQSAPIPLPKTGGPMPVSGDPVWLEDVLRPALGDRLKTLPGWKDSGVGGVMGDIFGVIWHHTGSARATAQSIRDGRPDLPGPLSQLHIAQDGTVTIVAVGPCNHAGKGSWTGLPTDNANTRTIGVECAYPKDVNNQAERWPDAQIVSMRDTAAALTKHLQVPVSHNISHKEWAQLGPAGFRQGKTDPWNLDMDWFREEVQKDMDGFVFPGEHPPIAAPPPVKRFPDDWTDRELMVEILRQLRGPTLKGWAQLGGKSVVDAVADLGKDA